MAQVQILNWPATWLYASIGLMATGYSQFCPVAKGAEIVATRWTPLILREIMCGSRSFNDIHRGVPLMSRALLAQRLRQLEEHDIIEREARHGHGHDYRLTPAGEALRPVIDLLGQWGLTHGRQRLVPGDRDPTVLVWALRRRANCDSLPSQRVVIRFEFSGVPRCRTGVQLFWLVLERSGVDVCLKDPGFAVDVTIACDVSVLIAVYLGHVTWERALRNGMRVTADGAFRPHIAKWLSLDQTLGRDRPVIPPAA